MSIIIFTNQVQTQGNSISFSPDRFLCDGDVVEIVCFVESSVQFSSNNARVSIDSSSPAFTLGQLNTDSVQNGVDLSRYTANIDGLTRTVNRPGVRVIIGSYQPSDSNTVIGCHGVFDNGTESLALASGQPNTTAVPPSISTPIATIQNFNPSTCEGTLRFNLAATSDRDITSYSILFNGSSIASNLPSSNTEFIYNTQFLLNTNYPTSIIASSCAGNSTDGDASVRVNEYSQCDLSCAEYNNVTGVLNIDWTLNTPSQPTGVSGISIAYSVRVTYSHSNGTVTYLFTDTSIFNLMSTVTTYDVPLTAHNFINPQRVETNITAHVRILQQCGQDLVGTELSCSLRSVIILPDTTTSTVSTIPSVPSSTSSILTTNNTSSTPTCSTNTPCCTCSNTGESSQLIIPNVILGLLFLIALIIIAVFVIIVIFLIRKNKQLNSSLTVKPAPSHPYEYIDLDKMSGNISSPTQQQFPQDYVPMSSVHKQDPTKPPTFYANLK